MNMDKEFLELVGIVMITPATYISHHSEDGDLYECDEAFIEWDENLRKFLEYNYSSIDYEETESFCYLGNLSDGVCYIQYDPYYEFVF